MHTVLFAVGMLELALTRACMPTPVSQVFLILSTRKVTGTGTGIKLTYRKLAS